MFLLKHLNGILDLYNKEKEKNAKLLDEAIVTYFDDEELKKSIANYLEKLLKKNIQKDYISKDKIKEKINYYEQKKKDLLGLPDDCAKMIASEDCDEKLYIYKELLEE
jgi:hypothetical protein